MHMRFDPRVKVFTTLAGYVAGNGPTYLNVVRDTAHWSDAAGCAGILIYTDNRQLDPWCLAQVVIENSLTISPLVAVQPAYAHPYAVAKKVATLTHLYGRQIHLNMVAGGFVGDLEALNDFTAHDDRYKRLQEYTLIIRQLLSEERPHSYVGDYYRLHDAFFKPALPADLQPVIFMAGSSAAGADVAKACGATRVTYPLPADCEGDDEDDHAGRAIRVGIIARQTGSDAWHVAHTQFPPDRRGDIRQRMAVAATDSAWRMRMDRFGRNQRTSGCFWLEPFMSGRGNLPYLVGTYADVAQALEPFLRNGFTSIILNVVSDPDELAHTATAINLAVSRTIGASDSANS